MKIIYREIFIYIIILGLFIFCCFVFFTSIQDIYRIGEIVKSDDTIDATIIFVMERAKNFEKAVYYKMANDEKLYRTHVVTIFSRNIIEPEKKVHIKSNKKGNMYVINEYLHETYATYILRVIISGCGLLLSFLLFSIAKKFNASIRK